MLIISCNLLYVSTFIDLPILHCSEIQFQVQLFKKSLLSAMGSFSIHLGGNHRCCASISFQQKNKNKNSFTDRLNIHFNKEAKSNKCFGLIKSRPSTGFGVAAVKESRAAAMDENSVQHHTSRPIRIFISTGDVMGDMNGATLTKEFLKQAELVGIRVKVYALGGHRMKAAGAVLIGDNSGLSSIGFIEALPFIIPSLWLQAVVRYFLGRHPPDIVVLMDYPGVNIPFGRFVKEQFGCKLIYYIPPNEWLWTKARTNTIVRISDLILSIYPDESVYYKQAGANVVFVGHPLIDKINHLSDEEAKAKLGVKEDEIVIALIPASREQELRHVWPQIASAAKFISTSCKKQRRLRFFVPVIMPKHNKSLRDCIEKYHLSEDVQLWFGDSHVVMAAADMAITKSGSVNLELALYNIPQVVVYRIDGISAWIARTFFGFPSTFISIVNLILGYKLVPEFIQDGAKPEKIAEAALKLLPLTSNDNLERKKMLDGYKELHRLLGNPGVATRAAKYILQTFHNSREGSPSPPGDAASA